MDTRRTSPDDLNWWLTFAPHLTWTTARTYADTAPHEYIVAGRTPGVSAADLERAARVIATFGEPGRFHRSTDIYLTHSRDPHRYWGMVGDLVNRATNDRVYGLQDAPRTYFAGWSEYDAIGAVYDEMMATRRTPERTTSTPPSQIRWPPRSASARRACSISAAAPAECSTSG